MSDDETESGRPTALVTEHLEQEGVAFELVEHERRFGAASEAEAAGIAPENAAKTVLLRDDDGYRLAVIPASERLDMRKLREQLGEHQELRLATEAEMEADFKDFELGALPPLGEMIPAPEIVDSRLLEHERVLCNAGDHEHSLLIDPHEIIRVSGADQADICQD